MFRYALAAFIALTAPTMVAAETCSTPEEMVMNANPLLANGTLTEVLVLKGDNLRAFITRINATIGTNVSYDFETILVGFTPDGVAMMFGFIGGCKVASGWMTPDEARKVLPRS